MTTNKYDSLAEHAFHKRHPELVMVKGTFQNEFHDGTQTFQACPDFWDPSAQCYIEFKCHQLNNHLTKSEAAQKLQSAIEFKGHELLIDKLKHGWNHSYIKQSIVQRALAEKGIHLVLVFADKTKLSTQSKNRMKLAGLKWQYETAYFSHKSCTKTA